MLRAAVIEKDKEKREFVRNGILGMDLDISVSAFSNEFDFKEKLDDAASSFDMVVLNTTLLREGDGVALASFLRGKNRKVFLCFATDSQRYYAEAFSVFATGYLLYPFDIGELYNCISFYYQKTTVERRASWMVKVKGGNYRRIFCRNITYIENYNREVMIHLEDGSVIESYYKLEDALAILPKKNFLRCHQSYILNLYYVEELERNCFHLQDADVPISRKYQNAAKDAYYDYMFEKV